MDITKTIAFRMLYKMYKWISVPGKIHFDMNLLYVRLFDWIHGTTFAGRLKQDQIGTSKERANDYSATPTDIIKTLKKIGVTTDDSIIDMGCGKGLAMYYMGKFDFCKVGGVELSSDLAEEAKKNLEKLDSKGCINGRYEVVCADAGKFVEIDGYNYFYIYNSFPEAVLQEVMNNIDSSIERKRRKVTILYLYPEFANVINDNPKWKLVSKGSKREVREGMHIYINI